MSLLQACRRQSYFFFQAKLVVSAPVISKKKCFPLFRRVKRLYKWIKSEQNNLRKYTLKEFKRVQKTEEEMSHSQMLTHTLFLNKAVGTYYQHIFQHLSSMWWVFILTKVLHGWKLDINAIVLKFVDCQALLFQRPMWTIGSEWKDTNIIVR